MSDCPEPSKALLELLIRRAMARGVPGEDAEDIVLRSYHKVAAQFDPARGSFEALYMATVDNECRYFWRTWQRQQKRTLRLVREPGAASTNPRTAELAVNRQRQLLAALDDTERSVFSTWALQRHLPRGTLKAAEAAQSLQMTAPQWENAKRRLKTRITSLLTEWGLAPRDLFSLEDDERPQRSQRR